VQVPYSAGLRRRQSTAEGTYPGLPAGW